MLNTIIPLRYDDYFFFSDDNAFVKLEGKYGCISKAGEQRTPHRYDSFGESSEGLLAVQEAGKWGYIDQHSLAVVIPFVYDNTRPFQQGIAAVKKGNKWGFIDCNNQEMIAFTLDEVRVIDQGYYGIRSGKTWGIADPAGKALTDHIYEDIVPALGQGNPPTDIIGMIRSNKKWGLIDCRGTEILPCTYKNLQPFNQGLAVAEKGRDGMINLSGQVVIPVKYYHLSGVCDGLVQVTDKDGNRGYLDETGAEAIPITFKAASDFSEGYAAVRKHEQEPGESPVLDATGFPMPNYGFVDKTGREASGFVYKHVRWFQEGMAVVQTGEDKWGALDTSGSLVIPAIYDQLSSFSEGYAAAQINGKWGYIDKAGPVVVPFEYGEAKGFYQGVACVMQQDKWGAISI